MKLLNHVEHSHSENIYPTYLTCTLSPTQSQSSAPIAQPNHQLTRSLRNIATIHKSTNNLSLHTPATQAVVEAGSGTLASRAGSIAAGAASGAAGVSAAGTACVLDSPAVSRWSSPSSSISFLVRRVRMVRMILSSVSCQPPEKPSGR